SFVHHKSNRYIGLFGVYRDLLPTLEPNKYGVREEGLATLRDAFDAEDERVNRLHQFAREWPYHSIQRSLIQEYVERPGKPLFD
ncbi:MAG: hypothetical protein ABEI52_07090, partial [Halobacteriaceae archaeon]